jgi:predicted permease
MQVYVDVLLSILPVLCYICIGFLLQKIRFFREVSVQEIKKLVLSIALPCLLFIAFSQLDLQIGLLPLVLLVLCICIFMVYIGKLLSRAFGIRTPYFAFLLGGFETGMLGYAIFISMYGIGDLDKIAVCDLGVMIFLWFFIMPQLLKANNRDYRPRDAFRLFVTSPVVIAIFLGIGMSFLRRSSGFTSGKYYASLNQLLLTLGNMTVPLICITIGHGLRINIRNASLPLAAILIRCTVHTGMVLAINKLFIERLLGLAPIYSYAMITMFVLPPSFVPSLFLKVDDAETTQFVHSTLSLHTVVSFFLFIVVTSLYPSL